MLKEEFVVRGRPDWVCGILEFKRIPWVLPNYDGCGTLEF